MLAQTRAELLEDLQVDLVGLAAAAVLLGVGQAEHADLPEHPEDVAREGLARLVGGRAGRELLVGEVAHELDQVGGLGGGHHAAGWHGDHSRRGPGAGRRRPLGRRPRHAGITRKGVCDRPL